MPPGSACPCTIKRNRILTFVNPDKYDSVGISWNQRQSLISVGSGGLTGKGWTEGTQAQLGYLPRSVAHNDFVFAVIAEEKGFLGSLTVLGLFGLVLFNGIRIAGSARDRLGALLAIGVTVLFTVHVFVNIAMTIGLVPITGIPLPFISYGGPVLSCLLRDWSRASGASGRISHRSFFAPSTALPEFPAPQLPHRGPRQPSHPPRAIHHHLNPSSRGTSPKSMTGTCPPPQEKTADPPAELKAGAAPPSSAPC